MTLFLARDDRGLPKILGLTLGIADNFLRRLFRRRLGVELTLMLVSFAALSPENEQCRPGNDGNAQRGKQDQIHMIYMLHCGGGAAEKKRTTSARCIANYKARLYLRVGLATSR